MRVLLIRHGLTDWNAQRRWQGMADVPLNEEGRQQAALLAKHLSHHKIDRLYTSDLNRAWDTARVIGETLGLVPETDPRLRETNLGIFQGLTADQINRRYPREHQAMRADYYDYVIPRGESRRQLQNRAYAAFVDIAAKGGNEIAIVSHGGTIAVLLRKLLPDNEQVSTAHITNTSITTLEYKEGYWHLIDISATPHLGEVKISPNKPLTL
jgi:broad specificity phosphatase PhoE